MAIKKNFIIAAAGLGLGMVGSVLSNHASERRQEEVIDKKIEEKLNKTSIEKKKKVKGS